MIVIIILFRTIDRLFLVIQYRSHNFSMINQLKNLQVQFLSLYFQFESSSIDIINNTKVSKKKDNSERHNQNAKTENGDFPQPQ